LEAFGDFVLIWCACGSGSGAKSWVILEPFVICDPVDSLVNSERWKRDSFWEITFSVVQVYT
jgi:hypothetical protein